MALFPAIIQQGGASGDLTFGTFIQNNGVNAPVDNNSYYFIAVLIKASVGTAPTSITGADIIVPFFQGPTVAGTFVEFYGVIKTTASTITVPNAYSSGNIAAKYIKVSN